MEGLEYGVSLEDKMSGPAKAAAQSLHTLATGAEHAKGSLSELMGGFIKTVEPAEVLKGSFEQIGAGVSSMVAGFKSGEVKEVVAGAAESLAGLATMLDLVYPGLGQVASAAIKMGGAFASATVGIVQAGTELAIEATLGKLSMIDMFSALGGGQKIGEQTEEMISGLSQKIGIAKDELAPFTASFSAMGVEGVDALEKVTLAAVSARAIMKGTGKDGAQAFESLTKKIQVAAQTGHGLKIPEKGLKSLGDMGLRVDDVAKRMNMSTGALSDQLKKGTVDAAKFGDAMQEALIEKGAGPLARMGSSLANLKKMFGQSIEDMFEDMGDAVQPLLDGLKDLGSIFSQNTESGKAMKAGIGGAFTFVLKAATSAILPIKHFFLDLVIWSLKGYIMLKKHWSEVKNVLIGLGAAMATVGLAAAMFVAPFIAATVALTALGVGIAWLIGKLSELQASAMQAGKDFVSGLVDGITGGISRVIDAAKSLGKSAIDAVKNVWDSHSPSKALFTIGEFGGEGVAMGLEASTGRVASAADALGATAISSTTAGLKGGDYALPTRNDAASKTPTTPTGGNSYVVNVTAPSGITHALELTEIALATLLERLALSQGVT